MLPADVCFFEDVFHVIFIEIMPLHWDCAVCVRVVVNIVIRAVPFQFITRSGELFDRLLPWIHCFPPLIILYTKLCIKSMRKYTKIHKKFFSPKGIMNWTLRLLRLRIGIQEYAGGSYYSFEWMEWTASRICFPPAGAAIIIRADQRRRDFGKWLRRCRTH